MHGVDGEENGSRNGDVAPDDFRRENADGDRSSCVQAVADDAKRQWSSTTRDVLDREQKECQRAIELLDVRSRPVGAGENAPPVIREIDYAIVVANERNVIVDEVIPYACDARRQRGARDQKRSR
jgi:hypothetical protein